jgi:hypothetical protein
MIVRELNPQLRLFSFGLKLAIVLFPSFFLLDYVYYPEHKFTLLAIRLGISAYLVCILYLIRRVSANYYVPMISSGFLLSAFSLSLMCYITGEGFASPYCISMLQVIIMGALFFNITPRYYIVIICCMIAQHFILLNFIPWDVKNLMINIFGIGVFAAIGVMVHFFIHKAVNDIHTLRGILPICSGCKKIRDAKGYWHQLESYILANSEAELSHSICPDCIAILYPEYVRKQPPPAEPQSLHLSP